MFFICCRRPAECRRRNGRWAWRHVPSEWPRTYWSPAQYLRPVSSSTDSVHSRRPCTVPGFTGTLRRVWSLVFSEDTVRQRLHPIRWVNLFATLFVTFIFQHGYFVTFFSLKSSKVFVVFQPTQRQNEIVR